MISLILAESSLELVPANLQSHPSVISHARKLGKKTSEILLDNSWHFAAMKGLDNEIKRGRPDLVHFTILESTSIPLFFENKIDIYIHTINDKVIHIYQNVHIPKSYHRFAGLFEKLFIEKNIKTENHMLLSIKDQTFSELIEELNPSKIIGLSTKGKPSSVAKVAKDLSDDSCIVIGGFQKGHFSDQVENNFSNLISVGKTSLEAHVVTSRVLYEYEKTIFM